MGVTSNTSKLTLAAECEDVFDVFYTKFCLEILILALWKTGVMNTKNI